MKTVIRTVLIADEGMILTDGESFGREVYLAEGADVSEWREIPKTQAEEAQDNGLF